MVEDATVSKLIWPAFGSMLLVPWGYEWNDADDGGHFCAPNFRRGFFCCLICSITRDSLDVDLPRGTSVLFA